MDDGEDPGDCFAIPDLWKIPQLLFADQESAGFLFSELKLHDVAEILPHFVDQNPQNDDFFALPDLSFGPSNNAPTPTSSVEPLVHKDANVGNIKTSTDDIWAFVTETPLKTANYLSWNGFQDEKYEEPFTCYISEAGPGVFDAAIGGESDLFLLADKDSIIIESQTYAISLMALGLGRSSVLFSWNEGKGSFEVVHEAMRISGCTKRTVGSVQAMFMSCGNITRNLQSFVDTAYVGNTTAAKIALADAVSTMLSTLQTNLNVPPASIHSILQLQAIFEPAESILKAFHVIVQSVATSKNDEAMLSKIYEQIETLEHRMDSIRQVLLEVLSRVSRPFLDFAGEWIGLHREASLALDKLGSGKSFVKTETKSWVDEQGMEIHEPDFVFDPVSVPSFIQESDARMMFETGRSLRFMKTHHSNHPLSKGDILSSIDPPKLEWQLSWHDIELVESKALQYENDLKAAIKLYATGETSQDLHFTQINDKDAYDFDFFGKPESEMEAHVLKSMATLSQPLWSVRQFDRLANLLYDGLTRGDNACSEEETTFAPPISLVPFLSFNPIIAAQARVVNITVMRLFFKSHNLREHLSVQRRFHLLGDGMFSTRLSHALFDPELESAERHAGIARTGGTMGLRLGGRDTWPPASSELRLALMGVLTECYASAHVDSTSKRGGYLDRKAQLPGDLSFAVRDMSEEEIDKCMDPNSLEALDFLRLSYRPPPPLEAIITPLSLYKYDQLFKLLLRAIRMLYVVSQLSRDARDRRSFVRGTDVVATRFRNDAHHFVSCVIEYFFETGINATWRIFERKLDQLEKRIDSDDNNATLGHHEGLENLSEYHDCVLDRIMFALFLRKRQQPVLKLLEEIFTLILQFAQHTRSSAVGVTAKAGADTEVKELYLKFRRKIEIFITVCKGMSEKKGFGDKGKEAKPAGSGGIFDRQELAEDNTVVQLLARLEMSGYYTQHVKL